jgi:hypothetical protein
MTEKSFLILDEIDKTKKKIERLQLTREDIFRPRMELTQRDIFPRPRVELTREDIFPRPRLIERRPSPLEFDFDDIKLETPLASSSQSGQKLKLIDIDQEERENREVALKFIRDKGEIITRDLIKKLHSSNDVEKIKLGDAIDRELRDMLTRKLIIHNFPSYTREQVERELRRLRKDEDDEETETIDSIGTIKRKFGQEKSKFEQPLLSPTRRTPFISKMEFSRARGKGQKDAGKKGFMRGGLGSEIMTSLGRKIIGI